MDFLNFEDPLDLSLKTQLICKLVSGNGTSCSTSSGSNKSSSSPPSNELNEYYDRSQEIHSCPSPSSPEPKDLNKYTRSYKSYPNDNLSYPMSLYSVQFSSLSSFSSSTDHTAHQTPFLNTFTDAAYTQFREKMLLNKRSHQDTRKKSNLSISSTITSHSISSPLGLDDNSCTSSAESENISISSANGCSGNNINNTNSNVGNNNNNNNNNNNDSNNNNNINNNNSNNINNNSNDAAGVGSSGSSGNIGLINDTINIVNNNSNDNNNNNNNNGFNRKKGKPLPDALKDKAYWERRRKNNEAAKRSRDARRAKENEIAIRAAYLEQENIKLKIENASLKNELGRLRTLIYKI